MKLSPIVVEKETVGFAFWCPGCNEAHAFYVTARHPGAPVWTFNQNMDSPSFHPSLIYRGERICHVIVTDGKIQFLADCWHELRSQTVPIPDWPYKHTPDEDEPAES